MTYPPLPADDLDHVVALTRTHWELTRGQRIFITGGTGFFGTWLLESAVHANRILDLGLQVTALSRDPAAFLRKCPHLAGTPGLEFLSGDVREFEGPTGDFRYVVHAASSVGRSLAVDPPQEVIGTLVEGTRRVLAFADRCGARGLLLISSGAVYGKQPPDLARIPENYHGMLDPLETGAAYGVGKRQAEQLCEAHARTHDCAVKIARCFAFVGPHLPLDGPYAMGNFIRDALAGGPIRVAGDGTPRRSYLYAADLTIWLWTMLFRGAAGCVCNVGSPDDISIGEVAAQVSASMPAPSAVEIACSARPGAAVSRYVPDTSRAWRDLQLRVWITPAEAIRKTIAWHRHANSIQHSHELR